MDIKIFCVCYVYKSQNINDDTVGEVNKMSLENKKLREMLTLVWDNNNILKNHVNKLMQDHDLLASNSVKRKLSECDECNTDGSKEYDRHGTFKRTNNGITRVYRRIDPSDKSMVLYMPLLIFIFKAFESL